MITAGVTKILEYRRSFAGNPATRLFLTIKDTQGVTLHAAPTVFAQLFIFLLQKHQEVLSVARPALNASERVQL